MIIISFHECHKLFPEFHSSVHIPLIYKLNQVQLIIIQILCKKKKEKDTTSPVSIHDVVIQLRFYEVQSYTSFTCEKKTLKETFLRLNFNQYTFSLTKQYHKNNSYDHKKCSTQLLNLVTRYHFFYVGFKSTCYQCSRIKYHEYICAKFPVLCIYQGLWI